MRVLLDYRPALRQRTGVGEYVHQLARALAEPPADFVELFTSSWKDRPSAAALAELGPAIRVVDRRIPVQCLNTAWHRLGWPPVEWLTGREYDVVHSTTPMLIPSRRAARVVTIHDLDFLTHPERTRGEMRRTYPALVGRHAALADGIIVPAQHMAEQVVGLLHVPAERISVCPHGVPQWARIVPAPPGGLRAGYILFLGTLEPRKNIDGLLAAYSLLIERRPDAPPLVLAGASVPGAEAWRDTIARPPLAGRVTCCGYVEDGDRQAIYAGARLLVLPSFDEGFGLPVVEAMSLGVPAVCTNRGSLPEVTGGAALLVDPEDLAGLSDAIERVVFDGATAGRLAEAGLRQARRFTWSRAAELTRAAYERAIDARHRCIGG